MAEKQKVPNNTGAGKPQGFRQEYKHTAKQPSPEQVGASGKGTTPDKF